MQLVLFVFVLSCMNTEYLYLFLNTNLTNLTNKESELIVSGILVQIVQKISAHICYLFFEHESLE